MLRSQSSDQSRRDRAERRQNRESSCRKFRESERGPSRDRRNVNPRNTRKRSDNYEDQSSVGPLRSPLRPNVDWKQDYQKSEEESRTNKRRNVSSAGKMRSWKKLPIDNSQNPGNHDDFPPLDQSRMTPEQRSSRKSRVDSLTEKLYCVNFQSPTDWDTVMDREDQIEKDLAKYRRKLLMSQAKENNQRSSQNIPKPVSAENVDSKLETDHTVLLRREKQIVYGKGTDGYRNYRTKVEKEKRTKHHPKTPNKFRKCSRRSWDMQVKIWRRKLHHWDKPEGIPENGAIDFFRDSSASETSSVISLDGPSTASCTDVSADTSKADTSNANISQAVTGGHPAQSACSTPGPDDLSDDLMDFALSNGSDCASEDLELDIYDNLEL